MRTLLLMTVLTSLVAACAGTDPDRTLTPIDSGGDDDAPLDGGRDADDDGDAGDGETPDDVGETDARSEDDASQSVVCRPNRDGIITRGEIPLRAGLAATFRVAHDVPVDLEGETTDEGRVWDFSGNFEGDHSVLVELRDPAQQWWSTEFPAATYFTRLSDTADLFGVFELGDDSLSLAGVVSPDDGFSRTELSYDPVVSILRFPLEEGDTWQTEADVNGLAQGVAASYDEDYSSIVDASGVVKTPFGDFPVLRIRVDLERRVGLYTTTTRTFMFVSECFGTVATVVSEENEEEVEFETAAELRRLSP